MERDYEPTVIHRFDPEDGYLWDEAFLVLAVERCRPFWREAGVPPRMVDDPRALFESARVYGGVRRGVLTEALDERNARLDPQIVEKYAKLASEYRMSADLVLANLRRFCSLLDLVFRRLEQSYGQEDTEALHRWIKYAFFYESPYHTEFLRSTAWERVMISLIHRHRSPSVWLPLGPSRASRFIEAVELRYGSEARARFRERVADARKVPLSPLEKGLVSYGGDAARPVEPHRGEVDVVGIVQRIAWIRRASEVLKEADSWLTPAERDAIWAWASRIDPDVRLPERGAK